ncbi:hypothetical protein Glove_186g15 [Diversispora epigaea]|uniref:Protein kinase domain-containing protein n=1 Tax=Diversispora epigaea TaxID=1348612 RepID=A0A397IQ49_9GLOM|nr:hypothetical protein Glove_186g15 [Diversispora epigaea]
MCSKCYQDNTGRDWCHPCNAEKFQNEFDKWTSGDKEIDKFIQQIQLNANKYQGVIEWIPFDRLKNVTYLAKGGFGTVYKANWFDGFIKTVQQGVWYRNGEQDVCLKSLDNLTNKNDFLQEIKNQFKFRGKNSIAIYGITKNPTKNEYMMVMNYAVYGSLRKMLNDKFEILTWRRKSLILLSIIWGIKYIHEMGLMHKDFHPGNIVNQFLNLSYITDFGLCKPVTENNPEKIYGVIPYMAPETLSGGEYTQASDIYSFGMVMLEVLTGYPPYYNIPHNVNLAMDICKGLKPEIKCEIPQFFKEIMEKCLNFESLNRPTAKELEFQLNKYMQGDEIRKQIKAANKSNKNFIKYDPNEMHPEAIYTSRLIPKITIPKYDTFNSRQQFFSIPNNIIVENEENETQEMELSKVSSSLEKSDFLNPATKSLGREFELSSQLNSFSSIAKKNRQEFIIEVFYKKNAVPPFKPIPITLQEITKKNVLNMKIESVLEKMYDSVRKKYLGIGSKKKRFIRILQVQNLRSIDKEIDCNYVQNE